VLLHGGSGSWVHWMRNIPHLLSRGYVVYAPDLPGFGDSSAPPAGFDADAQTEWIARGLDHLLGKQPYTLTAFSFGSLVATFVAAQAPPNLERLVLVGAPSLVKMPERNISLRNWRQLHDANERRQAHRHNLRELMLADDTLITDFVIDVYGHDAERDQIPQRRLFKTDAIRQLMPSLQCPVWGIWGEHDVLYENDFPAIKQSLSLAPRFQGMEIIRGAGHWVQFEAFQAFNAALTAAIDTPVNAGAPDRNVQSSASLIARRTQATP